MAEALASLTFLPWLRRGVLAMSGASANPGRRLTIPVEVSFGEQRRASRAVTFFGPEDVIGIDPRMVIRTWPAANIYDAEPNLFPIVEFDQPDLPWRYTPATVASNDRLQPWLVLIVLSDEEIAEVLPSGPMRPLSVVVFEDAPLPRLDQAWAWAHAQVAGVDRVDPAATGKLLKEEPYRLVSRLLCPRRLEPKTRYNAFVVPAYESGRRAGLGQPPDAGADPARPAWANDARAGQLPVFFQWRFGTAVAGDFEELVRRLKARELPSTVGFRHMDVSDPGAQLPLAARKPLGLEGALTAPAMKAPEWPAAEQQPFVEALRLFLNRPSELLEGKQDVHAVAPPLYGRWHAGERKLTPGQPPPWFQQVNSDPRLRAAAGLGTQVIQANQRQLLASAWEQAPQVDEINMRLRFAQFAREITSRIYERHLVPGNEERIAQITAPVHSRVLNGAVTVASQLRESPIAPGALAHGWRRISRPLGAIGRRQKRAPGEVSQALTRMNHADPATRLSPVSPLPKATKVPTASLIGRGLVPDWSSISDLDRARLLAQRLGAASPAGTKAVGLLFALGDSIELAHAAISADGGSSSTGKPVIDHPILTKIVANQPARTRFVAIETNPDGTPKPAADAPRRGRGDSPSAVAFRLAMAALLPNLDAGTKAEAQPKVVELAALRQRILRDLDPARTIGSAISAHLSVADRAGWKPTDPLEPILVGPEFEQPMYRPLAELSNDWLLPGLDQVPANTVTLAKTNRRFVEAYMLGLNHEMGRELLWHEYPTDQRKTYFRQFWDPSGFVAELGQTRDGEALQDVKSIHLWQNALGENSSRATGTREQLVMLLRGDVVQRYPNLIVYATRALWTDNKRDVGTEEKHPVFSGTLKPDVAFFGFALSVEQARGNSITPGEGDPGWFFVIQEQSGETRFGLDSGPQVPQPLTKWRDLNWRHLAASDDALNAIQYIDLDAGLPNTNGISSPPGVAWHGPGAQSSDLAYITLQVPVRVAVHAADMLDAAP